MTARARDITLRLMDLEEHRAAAEETIRDERGDETLGVKFGFTPYAAYDAGDTIYVVCHEGVGWEVTADEDLELGLYVSHPNMLAIAPSSIMKLSIDEVREVLTDEVVNLADHVRKLGRRLEDNFWVWHRVLRDAGADRKERADA